MNTERIKKIVRNILAQKNSNSFISKVKQSIDKARDTFKNLNIKDIPTDERAGFRDVNYKRLADALISEKKSLNKFFSAIDKYNPSCEIKGDSKIQYLSHSKTYYLQMSVDIELENNENKEGVLEEIKELKKSYGYHDVKQFSKEKTPHKITLALELPLYSGNSIQLSEDQYFFGI